MRTTSFRIPAAISCLLLGLNACSDGHGETQTYRLTYSGFGGE